MGNSKIKKVCQECGGRCCLSVNIAINYNEPAAEIFLEKYYADALPEGHNLWDDSQREDNWFYDSNREPCMFFDEKKIKCNIEKKKPVICATYPLKWKHQHSFFIDLGCRLSHNIPLLEIAKNADQFKEIITEINLYNNFDQNDQEKFFSIRKFESRFDRGIYK